MKNPTIANKRQNAVVLLSGGQDSTTCLFWAKKYFKQVFALSIQYHQRHSIELESAKRVAEMARVNHRILDFDVFKQFGDSSMIEGIGDVLKRGRNGLPSTFLPGRNIIFLTLASAYGLAHNAYNIVGGMCEVDYSGYPDCRAETIAALQTTLRAGIDRRITIWTPLMHLSKAAEVRMAKSLRGCWEALAHSHTCYEGKRPPCGKCPACKLRAKGFYEAGFEDPIFRNK